MINTALMAVVDSIKDLKEGDFDAVCVMEELVLEYDGLEQVTASAEIKDNVGKLVIGKAAMERDNVGVV